MEQQTSKQYFNTLARVHWAIVGGQFFFALIALIIVIGSDMTAVGGLEQALPVAASLVLVAAVVTSRVVTRRIIASAGPDATLPHKLSKYRTVLVIRDAIMDVPVLLSIIGFIVTHNYILLGFAALGMVYCVMQMPNRQRAIFELQLNSAEQSLIHDPETIVAETSATRDL
jgi:hypothetical protein